MHIQTNRILCTGTEATGVDFIGAAGGGLAFGADEGISPETTSIHIKIFLASKQQNGFLRYIWLLVIAIVGRYFLSYLC